MEKELCLGVAGALDAAKGLGGEKKTRECLH